MKKNVDLKQKSVEVADILKALSHPQRLLILCLLMDGEKSVGEIMQKSDLSQSQTSQFLIRLQKEGLLMSRKEGNFSMYSISDKKIQKLILSLNKIFCS
ncbi:ArsR family transcriptional regulator [Bacteriovorax stolpii]|uniref:Transcriptional regulator n=1 Tax=Bacteriovorax stolpii TaxID=960 RepID=A0A2K9NVR9_BACTC|nr:transcriptional regulator [Bacteriovorax stolpii]QDK41141.1 ArsR family transcriptional regulator [Bacteriovorax stolpii]TDP55616.1 ArsR family transcriptional regulator [Bacteriovorax stolpii]BDT29016.1 winged helix-turn-helix domain-containing protein [Bacteriovorax sp. HI3]